MSSPEVGRFKAKWNDWRLVSEIGHEIKALRDEITLFKAPTDQHDYLIDQVRTMLGKTEQAFAMRCTGYSDRSSLLIDGGQSFKAARLEETHPKSSPSRGKETMIPTDIETHNDRYRDPITKQNSRQFNMDKNQINELSAFKNEINAMVKTFGQVKTFEEMDKKIHDLYDYKYKAEVIEAHTPLGCKDPTIKAFNALVDGALELAKKHLDDFPV